MVEGKASVVGAWLKALGLLAGPTIAAYALTADLRGAQTLCGEGCSEWYRSGPLSSVAGIPLAGFGLVAWFILLALSWIGHRAVLVSALTFALAALGLQVVGLVWAGEMCPFVRPTRLRPRYFA